MNAKTSAKSIQRRMVNYASQRTVHFLPKGFSGKRRSTILRLNPLLGALLLAEKGEKKTALVPYLDISGKRDG